MMSEVRSILNSSKEAENKPFSTKVRNFNSAICRRIFTISKRNIFSDKALKSVVCSYTKVAGAACVMTSLTVPVRFLFINDDIVYITTIFNSNKSLK